MSRQARALLWAALTAAAAAGCRRAPAAASERLVVARAADSLSLDPARSTSNESIEVADQIFDRLVRFAPGRLEPEPALATSWRVSADATVWTFELRPHVLFHDGTPVDAEAVVFSFERQIDPRHPNHEVDFAWDASYRMIKRVTAKGPQTVEFELDRPYAPFLANLAMAPAAIVSPAAVRRFGSEFQRHPVGSGPFRFVEWLPGDRITLERNATCWDTPPRLRFLVFETVPDARQRLQALETGAADVIQQLAPDDLSFVRLHPDLALIIEPAATVSYLAFNTARPPLDDPRVRRALSHAIRRDALAAFVYQGLAEPAVGPLPSNVWGSRSDLVTYPFDPDRARQLLADAGYVARPDKPLVLYAPNVERQYLPSPDRIAQAIRASLAEVGVPVRVVMNEFREHLRATSAGEHDMALLGWVGDNGDPDNFLYALLDADNATGPSPQNIAFYRSARYHELVTRAQRTTVRAERERLYSEAQALLAADAPWMPLAHTKVVFAARAAIGGVTVTSSGLGVYRFAERL